MLDQNKQKVLDKLQSAIVNMDEVETILLLNTVETLSVTAEYRKSQNAGTALIPNNLNDGNTPASP